MFISLLRLRKLKKGYVTYPRILANNGWSWNLSLLFWPFIQQLLIGHPLCMEPGCSDIASVSLENIGHQQPHYHLPPSLGIGSWDPPAQDL